MVPDVLKATQILMVIASPAFYHQWIYFGQNYAMPDFITYFTKIIPLTPYLEAFENYGGRKRFRFLTKNISWHLFILGWVYFLLG